MNNIHDELKVIRHSMDVLRAELQWLHMYASDMEITEDMQHQRCCLLGAGLRLKEIEAKLLEKL